MSLSAVPGTARTVPFGFRLGSSWCRWLQLLGRPWSTCGCSRSLLCGWCTVASGGASPVSQSWRLFPACRRGYIHRVSAAWLVHVCGARVRAARTTWASRPGFTLRWHGLWCQLRLSRGGGPTQPVDAGTYTGSPRRGSSTSAELVSARHGPPGRVDHRSRRDDVAASLL